MRMQAEQIAALRADQEFWRALAAEVGPDRYAEPSAGSVASGSWDFDVFSGPVRARVVAGQLTNGERL